MDVTKFYIGICTFIYLKIKNSNFFNHFFKDLIFGGAEMLLKDCSLCLMIHFWGVDWN